jgi:hypothetical protein
MPRVPTYDGPQVAPARINTPYQNIQTSPVEFGGAAGRGLEQVAAGIGTTANLLARRAEEMRKEDDAAAAMEGYSKAGARIRDVLHDQEKGVLSRRGAQAMGALNDSKRELDAIYRDVSSGLKNEDQRRQFKQLFDRRQSAELDGVARHVARERQAYKDEATAALVTGAVEAAANGYRNRTAISEALSVSETAIRANGQGKPPEVIKQQLEAARSAIHRGVVERMSIDDPTGAKAYYDRVKGEVDGKDHAQIEKLLKDGVTRQVAQGHEDRIARTIGAGNLDDMLKEARKISDPAVRDDVVQRVKIRFAEHKATRDEAERANRDSAWGTILGGGGVDQVPTTVWSGLDGTTQKAMVDYVENRARRAARDNSDMGVYDKLNRMITSDLEGFKSYDILRHAPDLSERHLEKFLDLQRAARGADGDGKVTQLRTANQMVDDTLRKIGLDPSPPPDKRAEANRVALFRSRVQDELEALERREQRKAKPEDVQGILDRLIISGEVRGTGLLGLIRDPDKRLYEAEAGEEFFVSEVAALPRGERSKIEEALRRAGRPINDRAIVDLFNAAQKRKAETK